MNKLNNSEKIFIKKGLNEEYFKSLMDLIKICDEKDKGKSDAPYRDEEYEYLFYKENDILKGYLVMCPSFKEGEVKIKGTVHPSFRRKGIFTDLFQAAKNICKEKELTIMTIINEQTSKSGEAFALYKGGNLTYSAYQMDFNVKYYVEKVDESKDFTFRAGCDEDIDHIVKIGMEAFGTTEKEEREYNESNMKDPNKNVYAAEYDNKLIGMVTTIIEDGNATIFDLAVHKEYRRRGLGRRILSRTMRELLNKGIEKMNLGVDVENKNALSLYEDCGFRTVTAYDSYEINI